MPTRQRAYYDGRVVTVLSGDPHKGGKAKVKIRDIGFVKDVLAKDVTPMEDDDPNGPKLNYRQPRNMERFEAEK